MCHESRKAVFLEIEMMAEFVAEGTHECIERRDLVANRRPHPHANQHGFGGVVAKQFECAMLASS